MTREKNNDALAWSIYWAQDRLHSCVASQSSDDQKVFEEIWASLAKSLASDAQVLDLATGNGAVPSALLTAVETLSITAVDQANIEPASYVRDHPELAVVNFIGNVDINHMDHGEKRFDAVTSQFGIEYAGLTKATDAAVAYLKPNGHLVFVIHNAESALIQSSALKLAEANNLLLEDGLIDALHSVLRSDSDFAQLEQQGREYLDSTLPKTQSISGQVFAGIEQIAKQLAANAEVARNLAATLKLRLQSERDRLQQMQEAAQTREQIDEFQSHLQKQGFTISAPTAIYVDQDKQDYLLAWLIEGQRTA